MRACSWSGHKVSRFFRLPTRDPRTIARDIPGIVDVLFPQLIPGIVASLNASAEEIRTVKALDDSDIARSTLNAAMLFELGQARAEQILNQEEMNWTACLNLASSRQNRFYDAVTPSSLRDIDIEIAEHVASNTVTSLEALKSRYNDKKITISPRIAGMHWVSPSYADYATTSCLIEVKCTQKGFGASDYRQILLYWLLSLASSFEMNTEIWQRGILLNPRKNSLIIFSFHELSALLSGGKSVIELIEQLQALLADNCEKISHTPYSHL